MLKEMLSLTRHIVDIVHKGDRPTSKTQLFRVLADQLSFKEQVVVSKMAVRWGQDRIELWLDTVLHSTGFYNKHGQYIGWCN